MLDAVTRSMTTLANAPAALDRMLHVMFEHGEADLPEAESGRWDEVIGSFRGDTSKDGESVWITLAGGTWSFARGAASPRGSGTRVLGEATARAENAAATLNGLLEEMIGGAPVPQVSAQEVYRQLLKAYVGPALREDGYQGSGGDFHRMAGGDRVGIQFQKSRHSTRDRVEYLLNIHVGSTHRQFPGWTPGGGSWLGLRPGEDLAAHAARLLSDIRGVAYPAIEAQLRLLG